MRLFKQYFKQWQSFKKNKTFKIINAHTTVGVATMPMFTFLAILGQFNWHCGTEHNQQQFWQHQGRFHFYSENVATCMIIIIVVGS